MDQVLAISGVVVLIIVAGFHIYWGHGGLWPGKNYQDLVDKILGEGTVFPSKVACYVVAIAVLISAVILLLVTRLIFLPAIENFITWITGFISVVFFARGIAGYMPAVAKRWKPIFNYYTRRIYNPLCLALGALFAYFTFMSF